MASLNKSGKTAVAEMDGIIAILAGESTRPNSASNLQQKSIRDGRPLLCDRIARYALFSGNIGLRRCPKSELQVFGGTVNS
jgi:hypothetical protein